MAYSSASLVTWPCGASKLYPDRCIMPYILTEKTWYGSEQIRSIPCTPNPNLLPFTEFKQLI